MACRAGGAGEKLDTLFPSWNGFLVHNAARVQSDCDGYDIDFLP
jgi:hypothetical protein